MRAASFKERFDALVDALRSDSRIDVYGAELRRPATDGELAVASKIVKRPLPPDVLAFYAAHDGAFLSWGLAGKTYQPLERFYRADYGTPPGSINIMPISRSFDRKWTDDSTVNFTADDHRDVYGADDEKAKRVRCVPIDFYSKYRHADLVFGPKGAPSWMLVATDHGADPGSSHLASFETYLETTLALWGVDRWQRFERGVGEARRVLESPVRGISLDEAIEAVERDARDGEG